MAKTDYSKLRNVGLNREIWKRRLGVSTSFADTELEGHDYLSDKAATWDALVGMKWGYLEQCGSESRPYWASDSALREQVIDANPARAVWLAWLAWMDSKAQS